MNIHFKTALLLTIAWVSLVVFAISGKYADQLLPFVETEALKNDSAAQIAEYVVNVFEDSKGNLWLATIGKGVARYDGKTLTYFSVEQGLIGNTVTGIAEDKAGNLWMGTHSGLSKYDGKTFTNFSTNDGLCNERVSQVFIDSSGIIWIGTWEGICRFDGTKFSNFPLPIPDIEVPDYQATENWVTAIMKDKHNKIWIGRSGYGACRYDPISHKFTQFTTKNGLSSNCVQSIVADAQGNLWFGFRVAENDHPDANKRKGVGGICRYDGKTFSTFPEMEALNATDVYTIYNDKAGNMWIGGTRIGLYCYDGKKFTLIKETNRMDLTYSFGLQAARQDRNGTLWLGFSGGLFRLQGSSIINVTQDGPWN